MACKNLLRAAFAAALAAARGDLTLDVGVRVTLGECSEAVPTVGQTFFLVQNQVQSEVTLAQLFHITYTPTFKVLTSKIAKEQYVLTQCGQFGPTDAAVDAVAALSTGYIRKHFSVPVQSAAAMSTVMLGFIDQLGVQDRVKYVDKYSCAACWQKGLACGAKLESSFGGNMTLRVQQIASVDVFFMDCGTNNDCTNVNVQANAVHVPTAQDVGPLASAEYVKYIAAFFNKEPEANQLFSAIKADYVQASSRAPANPLVVAWVNYNAASAWSPESFVVSQATYKTTMVTDVGAASLNASAALGAVPGLQVTDAVYGNSPAGKTYTILTSAFNGSKAAASAAFFQALSSVDVVVDEVYAYEPTSYNFDSFLSTYGLTRTSNLKFLKNQMVLRIDRTISAANGLDWYESRIARPDWALEGLAHVLYQDDSKRIKYFRNIARGETPDQVLRASACTKALPVCSAQTDPEAIPVLGDVAPVQQGAHASGVETRLLSSAVGVAIAGLWAIAA